MIAALRAFRLALVSLATPRRMVRLIVGAFLYGTAGATVLYADDYVTLPWPARYALLGALGVVAGRVFAHIDSLSPLPGEIRDRQS